MEFNEKACYTNFAVNIIVFSSFSRILIKYTKKRRKHDYKMHFENEAYFITS